VEAINYHLELTPAQLKITHTALRSLLDDFGHDETEIVELIRAVLEKLPDEHAIRAIQLDREAERRLREATPEPTDSPPNSAA
jgi:UDP-N-acetylmuramate-alanine ligase